MRKFEELSRAEQDEAVTHFIRKNIGSIILDGGFIDLGFETGNEQTNKELQRLMERHVLPNEDYLMQLRTWLFLFDVHIRQWALKHAEKALYRDESDDEIFVLSVDGMKYGIDRF